MIVKYGQYANVEEGCRLSRIQVRVSPSTGTVSIINNHARTDLTPTLAYQCVIVRTNGRMYVDGIRTGLYRQQFPTLVLEAIEEAISSGGRAKLALQAQERAWTTFRDRNDILVRDAQFHAGG
jgi:hypothetical protein